MPKSTGDLVLEGFQNTIRNYTEIKNNERKLKNEMLINQMKAEQNWLYKMKDKQTLDPMQQQQLDYQKKLGAQFESGSQPDNNLTADTNVMTEQARPEIRMGDKGYEVKTSEPKEWIFKRIQQKEAKGFALSKGEQKIKDKYLGIDKETPTDWDIQKEARARVNALLQNNFALQAEATKNPNKINQLINAEVLKIKQSQQNDFQPEPLPKVMPDNIKKTSEMVNYLMRDYGVSKEEAVTHLKQLYSNQ